MNDAGNTMVTSTLLTLTTGTAVVIGLGVFMGWLIARVLARNLNNVVATAQALGGGDLKARSSVATKDEVGQLAQAFNTMGENLQAGSAKQQELATAAMAQAARSRVLRMRSARRRPSSSSIWMGPSSPPTRTS